MIEIGRTLISLELLEQKFMCDLKKCLGACCVHGNSGAPLEKEELEIMEKIYPVVKEYMTPEGIAAIEQLGTHVVDREGDDVTPLIHGKECAFTYFINGIARCALETAFEKGKTNFKKPISCHLYPVRIKKYTGFEAVNFDAWNICNSAHILGEEQNMPLYKMLKEPLIRKYGEPWYKELETAAGNLKNKNLLL